MRSRIRAIGGGAAALLFLAGLLAACSGLAHDGQPVGAQVDEVDVLVLESFPVQIEVVIRGTLPDGCTTIDRVEQVFDPDENTFWIDLSTVRRSDEVCTQALVPFEETVSLDVYGLAAGAYTVVVNDVRDTFTLEVDNLSSDAQLPNPASAYCEEQGYRVAIRTGDQGNQYGVCVFTDGSECDEWAFFRGDCGPAD